VVRQPQEPPAEPLGGSPPDRYGRIEGRVLEVDVVELLPVEHRAHARAKARDLDLIPLHGRTRGADAGRKHVIEGARRVDVRRGHYIPHDLELHADGRLAPSSGSPKPHAAVAAGRDAVLEPEGEVLIDALGTQPAAALAVTMDRPILPVPGARSHGSPLRQFGAVRERYETLLDRSRPARHHTSHHQHDAPHGF